MPWELQRPLPCPMAQHVVPDVTHQMPKVVPQKLARNRVHLRTLCHSISGNLQLHDAEKFRAQVGAAAVKPHWLSRTAPRSHDFPPVRNSEVHDSSPVAARLAARVNGLRGNGIDLIMRGRGSLCLKKATHTQRPPFIDVGVSRRPPPVALWATARQSRPESLRPASSRVVASIVGSGLGSRAGRSMCSVTLLGPSQALEKA